MARNKLVSLAGADTGPPADGIINGTWGTTGATGNSGAGNRFNLTGASGDTSGAGTVRGKIGSGAAT